MLHLGLRPTAKMFCGRHMGPAAGGFCTWIWLNFDLGDRFRALLPSRDLARCEPRSSANHRAIAIPFHGRQPKLSSENNLRPSYTVEHNLFEMRDTAYDWNELMLIFSFQVSSPPWPLPINNLNFSQIFGLFITDTLIGIGKQIYGVSADKYKGGWRLTCALTFA